MSLLNDVDISSGPFCFFGETSLLDNCPRSASIVADSVVEVLEVAADNLIHLLNERVSDSIMIASSIYLSVCVCVS